MVLVACLDDVSVVLSKNGERHMSGLATCEVLACARKEWCCDVKER